MTAADPEENNFDFANYTSISTVEYGGGRNERRNHHFDRAVSSEAVYEEVFQ